LDDAKEVENVPLMHERHVDMFSAPTVVEKVPFLHCIQEDELEEPLVVE